MAPDGKDLILNADKARIEGAPSFAKNEWPDLNTWNSHSAYWLHQGTAAGTAAAVSSGRATGGTLTAGENSISGRVTAFDRASNALTVEDASGRHQFVLNDHASTTQQKSTTNAHWDNVKVGDHVTVQYHTQNGSYVVDNITDSGINR